MIQESSNWEHVAEQVRDSIVLVEVWEADVVPIGVGSGWVLTKDGYLITNEHVIAVCKQLLDPVVYVVFEDERRFRVQNVVASEEYDLALLKVNANHLDPLQLEKDKEPKIGQAVASFGNPWPFKFTMTQGIISNLDKKDEELAFPWIQNTAAINGGCSGGPLVSTEGKVVGVNEAYGMNKGRRLEALSLAIPASAIIEFLEGIMKEGLTPLKAVP